MDYTQTNSKCDDPSAKCVDDSACQNNTLSPSGNGIFDGSCSSNNFCIIHGWCPIPPKQQNIPRLNMDHLRNFTVKLDSYVTFTGLKAYNNMSEDSKILKTINCKNIDIVPNRFTRRCTTFRLGAILDYALKQDQKSNASTNDLVRNGLTIAIQVKWMCEEILYIPLIHNLDKPTCDINYDFVRLDEYTSHGFKENMITYHPSSDTERTLYINHAVNLVVQVESKLKRLSAFNIVTSISGKWSFFSICAIVLTLALEFHSLLTKKAEIPDNQDSTKFTRHKTCCAVLSGVKWCEVSSGGQSFKNRFLRCLKKCRDEICYTKLPSVRCKFCFKKKCDAINCEAKAKAKANSHDPRKCWGICSSCKKCDKCESERNQVEMHVRN